MILKIELEEHVWQRIVDMLATQPYREVGPIIAELAAQFSAQRKEKPYGKMATN